MKETEPVKLQRTLFFTVICSQSDKMNCNIIYIHFVRVEDSVHVVFLLHSQMDSTKHCCSVHQVFLM